ncbi:2'-5' RNA ligase [Planobispora rosea]|uniref:2'-5' RNA ligase n=1 Tax=Planobispora rosea TaxID=35762 RepID=A0A8J3S5K7_PLARO|nr:2'-5' RNA ligase family protein [Planobispora rosea]GGS92894.1 2'-5' RNA ligase [Planobispora rosea]GIH87209.1 2'-5' RNA ligase [Planobispora rosea]
MVAALELYLDPVAEKRIRTLWEALAREGVPSMRDLLKGRHRPHVSLISASRLDGPAVAQALRGMEVARPFELRFDFVGQFLGRVLWLGPVPTTELLAHHAAVHARLTEAGIGGFEVYLPGRWVPHCTLSMRVPFPKLLDAIRLCMDVLPIEATVVGAAVADHARDAVTPLR